MIGRDNLSDCTLCPRECHVNRIAGEMGYCNTGASYGISSVCLHQGEEPAISGTSGICNVFFSHCNMQCIFCQNHQISGNSSTLPGQYKSLAEILDAITGIVDTGINLVGFVSPSHMVPQMLEIIAGLNSRGYHPGIVYNSNGYDKVETLRELEGIVDIYLPDFKYADDEIAVRFSGTPGYFGAAAAALQEMYRQKGPFLHTGDDGVATSGMLIRHLVMPGFISNSIRVLEYIATELSPKISISLMSQYYPIRRMCRDEHLGRTLYNREYDEVVKAMEQLGFRHGYIQELSSHAHYQPDFEKTHPFHDDPANRC